MKLSGTTIILLIILGIIVVALLFAWIRPYTIKYDTTLHITGGLGTGKTLNATKIALNLWKRRHIRWRLNCVWVKFFNKIRSKVNESKEKWNAAHTNKKQRKIKDLLIKQEEPLLYSNIPMMIKKHWKNPKTKKWQKRFSTKLTKEHLLLQLHINEYSVVFIDELPQLVNQFNWNIEEVKNNLNEFITFFRHYIGGNWISTSQAIDDVVKQIRTKLNSYYWLFDFHKIFWLFYKVRITNMMATDLVNNVSVGFIEENTRWKYGCFLPKRYQSRCYKHRYDSVTNKQNTRWNKLFTRDVIRFSDYESPLDTKKGDWHGE